MKEIDIKEFIENNYESLNFLLDALKSGVWITDSKGKVILVNKSSQDRGGLKKEELVGKTMEELIEVGYILDNSSVINVMKSKREESVVQNLGDGTSTYVTGVPFFHRGNLSAIVCTEKNVTDTVRLKELLKEQVGLNESYRSKIEELEIQEHKESKSSISLNTNMYDLMDLVKKTAKLEATTLIIGESGTGKEVVANEIYENSARKGKPFVKINCAAIPENLMESEFFGYEKGAFTGASDSGSAGYFELANGGTIFLDEIGDLPLHMQPKLLRVLQEKEIRRIGGRKTIPVDVRILAATNIDLQDAIKSGRFREDLYYRLNIVLIELPPLRERVEDIKSLTYHFIETFNKEYNLYKTIEPSAVNLLEEYKWPGNVRELKNIIERLIVNSQTDRITLFHVMRQLGKGAENRSLINEIYQSKSLSEITDEFEKAILLECLRSEKSITRIAKTLKVDKSTVSRKLKKHKIDVEDI